MSDDQRWWRLLEASYALRRTPARRVVSEVYPNFRILDPDDLPTRAVFEFLRELLAVLEPGTRERQMQGLLADRD